MSPGSGAIMAERATWKRPPRPVVAVGIRSWQPRRPARVPAEIPHIQHTVIQPAAEPERAARPVAAICARGRHTVVSVVRLLAVLAVIGLASTSWETRQVSATTASRIQGSGAFLRPQSVVVVGDREVCSLLSSDQTEAGIVGLDGSHTVVINGAVYWNFGDTVMADGRMIPNTVGWSRDENAADCISLIPKEASSEAAPLLAHERGLEVSVWPLGMEATASDQVYFFYASVVPDSELRWRVAGVGLASFDPETLTAERALGGALIWPDGVPQPSRTFADEAYVYIFLGVSREEWTTDTSLARVAKASIESLDSYEYWDPGVGGEPGRWLGGLWNEETGSWDEAMEDIGSLWRQPGRHNGVEVAYNEFLGRWLGVYAAGFMTSINVRAADDLTGPWDDAETVLVRCPSFHPAPQSDYVCYTGSQHELYARDGGRTIYVSYTNGEDYQVYLHEIRLAAPVTQWSDAQGRPVYLAGDALAANGFRSDGLAFYASDIPAPGLTAIHRWARRDGSDIRYGPSSPFPASEFVDFGVDFYAPVDAAAADVMNSFFAPVYRWTFDGLMRYSPLNLEPAGWVRKETAFYAACPDGDGDQLTDCLESFLGTNSFSVDTDGDGLGDNYERTTRGCDPLRYNDDRDDASLRDELISGGNPCIWDGPSQASRPGP